VPKHKTDISKAELLNRYQGSLAINGDRDAFERLYRRWHERFFRVALRLSGHRDEAQDVMQDAALTLAKNIHKLDDPDKFSAWAFTIIRRRAADHIKRNIKRRDIRDRVISEGSLLQDNGKTETALDDTLDLKRALARLNEADRLLLTLFYIEGLTGPELSAVLDIPLGTVKSRLFAAREALKSVYIQSTPQKGDTHAGF
jgi:RNA polymerase sigma-70 factor (ECF subfamily)